MINEDKEINKTELPVTDATADDQRQAEVNGNLQEDLIRNDAIPETSKDTPGSNGVFPVGAFDTSKD